MRTPQSTGPFADFSQQVLDYLPTLAGGLVVLGIGIAAGWLAKRAAVRVLILLRLDRLATRVGWRAAFGKGDVRAALYNLVGSLVMTVVVLVFLENALEIWGLTVLSGMIDALVLYLPNLALVALIVTVGLLLTNTAASRVHDALEEENAPHPRLVARIFKSAMVAIVSALALWQLNFAREIVLAAFLISFGAIGVAFAVAVGLGSARAIQNGWEALVQRRKED